MELAGLSRDLDDYLNSNYVHVPRTLVEAVAFSLRYRDIARYVEQKLCIVRTLVNRCDAITTAIEGIGGDQRFSAVQSVIREVCRNPILRTLRSMSVDGRIDRLHLRLLDQSVRVDLRNLLYTLQSALGDLDAFASLAHAADILGWTFPQIDTSEGAAVVIEGLRHPLLPNGSTNDIMLSPHDRVMFVTGPNMAGKSTMMRALGLGVYFAHLGLPVAAATARIPLTDVLISSMTAHDRISTGTSFYLSEVRRVKTVVAAVRNGAVVVALLDEVFRGTNVKDAVDATQLLVAGLARAGCGLFVIASHLLEVAETIAVLPGISTWCMHVGEGAEGLNFSYRLQRGVSRVRLGVVLLEAEGVVQMLRELGSGRPHEGETSGE
ncbi:MAG: hypothetical protein WCK74_08255 [Gemmatimonadaceae bacterium]